MPSISQKLKYFQTIHIQPLNCDDYAALAHALRYIAQVVKRSHQILSHQIF